MADRAVAPIKAEYIAKVSTSSTATAVQAVVGTKRDAPDDSEKPDESSSSEVKSRVKNRGMNKNRKHFKPASEEVGLGVVQLSYLCR